MDNDEGVEQAEEEYSSEVEPAEEETQETSRKPDTITPASPHIEETKKLELYDENVACKHGPALEDSEHGHQQVKQPAAQQEEPSNDHEDQPQDHGLETENNGPTGGEQKPEELQKRQTPEPEPEATYDEDAGQEENGHHDEQGADELAVPQQPENGYCDEQEPAGEQSGYGHHDEQGANELAGEQQPDNGYCDEQDANEPEGEQSEYEYHDEQGASEPAVPQQPADGCCDQQGANEPAGEQPEKQVTAGDLFIHVEHQRQLATYVAVEQQEGAVAADAQQADVTAVEQPHAAPEEQCQSDSTAQQVNVQPDAQPAGRMSLRDEHLHQRQQHTTHSASTTGSTRKVLTFSGPPYVPKAKPYPRADYSHSTSQTMKIAHDNQLLMERLMSIGCKEPGWVREQHHLAPCNTASSAVNRHKQAATVAQENHALYQRLLAIKPSKDISRHTLEAEHRRHEAYRSNCATFKHTSH